MHHVSTESVNILPVNVTRVRSLALMLVDWISCVLPSNSMVGVSVRNAYGSGSTVTLMRLHAALICCIAEIASFVIEANDAWREDSGTVLSKHSVHAPSHVCAVVGSASSAAAVPVFLAPSATTGTLVATGRMGGLVAAVAPWTLETGQRNALSSSVQLVSCIARHLKSSAGDNGSSWVCDDGHEHAQSLNHTEHDFLSECASSSSDVAEEAKCHVTVHLIVTAVALPSWAEGFLSLILDDQFSFADNRCEQVLTLGLSTSGWTMAAAGLPHMPVRCVWLLVVSEAHDLYTSLSPALTQLLLLTIAAQH